MSLNDDIILSEEQGAIVKFSLEGRSFFFTGNAGTGKSTTLLSIINSLTNKLGKDAVAVTASTGIAASLVGGRTLHSWAGIGLGKESQYQLTKKIQANRGYLENWMTVKALIVDEISLITADLFDKLEFIGRTLKNTDEPFGGIQLIISGDFHQLPPVVSGEIIKAEHFAFNARTWRRCIPVHIRLERVWRQSDPEFLQLLEGVRRGGALCPATVATLDKLVNNDREILEPMTKTWLYPISSKVESKNREFLDSIASEKYCHKSIDSGKEKEKLQIACPVMDTLCYKVGAKVMLVKNLNHLSLFNGSIGQVRASANNVPQVQFGSMLINLKPTTWTVNDENGVVCASRRQLPIILSWAMTMHKAQGKTMDKVVVSLSDIFAFGQAYVALSRARRLEDLEILPCFDKKLPEEPAALQRLEQTYKSALLITDGDFRRESGEVNNPSTDIEVETPHERIDLTTAAPLPLEIDLKSIFLNLSTSCVRKSAYKALCTSLADSLSSHHSIFGFASYCWAELEKVFGPRAEDNNITLTESFQKSKLNDKYRRYLALINNRKLVNSWNQALVDHGALCAEEKLAQCHRTAFADLLEALRDKLLGKLTKL